ncbi:hypothetical protein DRN86_03870 [Candidatus Geothermarchaeota archaeon]|nr:MAG: hypothetical protein DRN86_03870 [Candidatus Geothermarchaeota archaeon]
MIGDLKFLGNCRVWLYEFDYDENAAEVRILMGPFGSKEKAEAAAEKIIPKAEYIKTEIRIEHTSWNPFDQLSFNPNDVLQGWYVVIIWRG